MDLRSDRSTRCEHSDYKENCRNDAPHYQWLVLHRFPVDRHGFVLFAEGVTVGLVIEVFRLQRESLRDGTPSADRVTLKAFGLDVIGATDAAAVRTERVGLIATAGVTVHAAMDTVFSGDA